MKRLWCGGLVLSLVVCSAIALRADVKTQEKSLVKFEGGLGRVMGVFGGKAAKGKTIEESGGMVMTSDMWLAPTIAALAEVQAFDGKFYEKLHGPLGAGMDAQQMAMASAFYPMMKDAMERMQKEAVKLDGTPLASATKFEGVKSQEQMAQASSQPQESGGGGIGGMLARKMMKKQPEEQTARSTIFTATHDVLSIATSAADTDVAVPAGYKEKKR